ncbi:MAG: hypothetical protein LC104_13320 [Bacteroidales bacterium]|nr:hypothetical protein [Bacteroidales bacterium]
MGKMLVIDSRPDREQRRLPDRLQLLFGGIGPSLRLGVGDRHAPAVVARPALARQHHLVPAQGQHLEPDLLRVVDVDEDDFVRLLPDQGVAGGESVEPDHRPVVGELDGRAVAAHGFPFPLEQPASVGREPGLLLGQRLALLETSDDPGHVLDLQRVHVPRPRQHPPRIDQMARRQEVDEPLVRQQGERANRPVLPLEDAPGQELDPPAVALDGNPPGVQPSGLRPEVVDQVGQQEERQAEDRPDDAGEAQHADDDAGPDPDLHPQQFRVRRRAFLDRPREAGCGVQVVVSRLAAGEEQRRQRRVGVERPPHVLAPHGEERPHAHRDGQHHAE